MKIGINIPNFGPGVNPRSLQTWAQFAVEVGFHLLMISDHVAITPDVGKEFPAPFYDPFISLSWLAAGTSDIEIGTTVTIIPYRHPLLTARMATNLDRLSGGRFILGVGVGWAKQEFEALGLPFHRRGAMTDEYLDVIKTCWAEDVASYHGRFVAFHKVSTGPRAMRPQGPPVWVGGSSDAALKRAVRYGDAWHPYRASVSWLKGEAVPKLHAIAEAEERPVPALCPRIPVHLSDTPLPEDRRVAGQGTLEQVRADLRALEVLGAKYVLLDTYTGRPSQTLHPENDWAMLRELTEHVLDLEHQRIREA